jgi:hypothetical protein
MAEIITKEIYDRFVSNPTLGIEAYSELEEIFEGLFVLDINFVQQNDERFKTFSSDIQRHYFNFLQDDIFLFSDNELQLSDYVYSKIKNDKTFINHINKIYDFCSKIIVNYGVKNLQYFQQKTSQEEGYTIYQNLLQTKLEKINSIYGNNYKLSQSFDIFDIVNDFSNKISNDNNLFNSIKSNALFEKRNNKIYLSNYFIDYISFIFFLDLKNNESTSIEYNQDFLNNFYFLTFGK